MKTNNAMSVIYMLNWWSARSHPLVGQQEVSLRLDLSACFLLRQNLCSWLPFTFKNQVRNRICCPKEVDFPGSQGVSRVWWKEKQRVETPRAVNLRLDQGSLQRTGPNSVIFTLVGLVGRGPSSINSNQKSKNHKVTFHIARETTGRKFLIHRIRALLGVRGSRRLGGGHNKVAQKGHRPIALHGNGNYTRAKGSLKEWHNKTLKPGVISPDTQRAWITHTVKQKSNQTWNIPLIIRLPDQILKIEDGEKEQPSPVVSAP